MGYPFRSPIDIATFFATIRKHQLVIRPIVHQNVKDVLIEIQKQYREQEKPGTITQLIPFESIIDWNNIYMNIRWGWN